MQFPLITMFEKLCNQNLGLLLLRLGIAAVFINHGLSKLMAMEKTIGFFGTLGFPPFLAWFVCAVELLGALALLLGIFTEIAGVALAIDMLVVLVRVPGRGGFLGGHELELMLGLAALAVAFAGPGKYAIPLGRKKMEAPAVM